MQEREQDQRDPEHREQTRVTKISNIETGCIVLVVGGGQDGNELLRELPKTIRHEKPTKNKDS